jgi:hypothetical protein
MLQPYQIFSAEKRMFSSSPSLPRLPGDNRENNNREDNNREVKIEKQKPRSNNREEKTAK